MTEAVFDEGVSLAANYISTAGSVFVVLNRSPSFDQQLAAASLNLALSSCGKKSNLLVVERVVNPTIAGLNNAKTSIGNQELVVGFDYNETEVDSVSYHIDEEEKKFYLTIKPQAGHQPLNHNSLSFDYVGAEADLIVLFGVSKLEQLEQIYAGYEDLFNSTSIISINAGKEEYDCLHLDMTGASSCCEAVYQLLTKALVEIDPESATNLLAGIQYETNNYIDLKTSADTFEAVAQLIRLGARRKGRAFSSVAHDKLDSIGETGKRSIFDAGPGGKSSGGKSPGGKGAGGKGLEKRKPVFDQKKDQDEPQSEQESSDAKKDALIEKKELKQNVKTAGSGDAKNVLSHDQPIRPSGLRR